MPQEFLVAPKSGRAFELYRRWHARWPYVVADSFERVDNPGLGAGDTGQAWADHWDVGANTGSPWEVKSRAARTPAGLGAGVCASSSLPTAYSDVKVSARLTWLGTDAGKAGPGLFYRSADDGYSGWIITYVGAGGYLWQTCVNPYPFGSGAAVLTPLLAIAGPAWLAGETHTLEVRCSGAVHTFYVDGAAIGAGAMASNGGRRHGLFHQVGATGFANTFHNFKALRL